MEFGMFHEFPTLPGRSHAEAFDEGLSLVDAAEAWGLDALWLAELHFAPERSLLAAPLTIASAVAARTKRIKIGIAVQVLPLCHPLRLAEEAATVDQLSRGRLLFGVGRSGVVATYDAYGVPYQESRDRFSEALDIIKAAWTGNPVSHRGRHWSFENVSVAPLPYQRPHPPIRMAASTSETYALIGELGLPIFVSARTVPWSDLGPGIGRYREAYARAGHKGDGEVYVSVPVYLADTDARAEAELERSIMSFYRYQANLQADSAARSGAAGAARAARGDRLRNLTYAQAIEAHLLVGTPKTVIEQIRAHDAELGLSGILAEMNCGGLIPQAQVMNALKLLCREVMPAFQAPRSRSTSESAPKPQQ
jgi:alkanesulfonate monooxygenase SsuD/methylene tetrahydromethanopterin reductase-like flavin-dependent oxidoreductase (luciferase family)